VQVKELVIPNLLKTEEVADLLRIHPATLANWRVQKRGPKHINLGRTVRYRATDVQRWIEQGGDS